MNSLHDTYGKSIDNNWDKLESGWKKIENSLSDTLPILEKEG